MQEQDLQQIKKIIDDSLDEKIKKTIDESLDEKLEKFKDEIVTTTKEQFDKHTDMLENIKLEIAKRPTIDKFENWREKQVEPIERDVDKLKYLHKDEWRNLSDSGIVNRELAENGMKV